MKSTIWLRLKIFAGVELVGFLIALAIPVTPSKSGNPFHWPSSWGEYLSEASLAFALANALFVVIFLAGWIYLKTSKAWRADSDAQTPGSEAPGQLRDAPGLQHDEPEFLRGGWLPENDKRSPPSEQ